ncbi:helix-turn-helix domain-containing protein [Empedobacter brevis]|uniref:helix-turn-helix domain-containing protein n=1 Tax=Empedobacter brevis TaxID=247 RepID=UPI0028A9A5AA|nr:helix-turn-helix transcriptional regulator [Empedobacter brevis]
MLRIKEILKEKNISQIELSNKLGMTTVGVNKLINGENPSLKTLIKISEALEVEVSDLFVIYPDKLETLYVKRGDNFIPIGSIKKEI